MHGLQVGANDLVSNLANRGRLDAQAPQCSFDRQALIDIRRELVAGSCEATAIAVNR
jgi:hypothetical protein